MPPSERVGGRPSVADFVDELTEVEHQVSQGPENSDPHRPRGMTSSTATKELDELMANLSKFEPASEKAEQPQTSHDVGRTKSTAMDNLNSMLGSLDEDMTKRHGVNTAPKGMCVCFCMCVCSKEGDREALTPPLQVSVLPVISPS